MLLVSSALVNWAKVCLFNLRLSLEIILFKRKNETVFEYFGKNVFFLRNQFILVEKLSQKTIVIVEIVLTAFWQKFNYKSIEAWSKLKLEHFK